MQTQFQYIIDLAKLYNGYSEKPDTLFEAINNLPKPVIEDIFKEYGDPERDFKPVNLLLLFSLIAPSIQLSTRSEIASVNDISRINIEINNSLVGLPLTLFKFERI